MIDILLLVGVALCAISVVLALIAVAATRAPRGAALTLVLGIALVFAGNWLDPRPFGIASLQESWQRLVSGQITLGTEPSAPVVQVPPAQTPAADTPAPAAQAPAGGSPSAAADAPAVSTPPAPATETATPAPVIENAEPATPSASETPESEEPAVEAPNTAGQPATN